MKDGNILLERPFIFQEALQNCSLQNASLFLVHCQFKNKELVLVQAGPSCPDSSRIIADSVFRRKDGTK